MLNRFSPMVVIPAVLGLIALIALLFFPLVISTTISNMNQFNLLDECFDQTSSVNGLAGVFPVIYMTIAAALLLGGAGFVFWKATGKLPTGYASIAAITIIGGLTLLGPSSATPAHAQLQQCLLQDGSTSPTANYNWGGFDLTNVGTLGATTGTVTTLSSTTGNITNANTAIVGFTDTSANPDANGELQRNGANLLYNDGTNAHNFLHQLTTSGQCAGYIAANGADADLKAAVTEARANYGNLYAVANGSDDDVEIQAAVDALAGTAGAICLSLSTFTASGNVALSSGQRIQGAGVGSYEVGLAEGTRYNYTGSGQAFTIGTSGSRAYNAGISDFMLVGTGAATHGVYIAGGLNTVTRITFDSFDNASGYVIQEDAVSGQNIITENWISNNAATGVLMSGSETPATRVTDNFFWRNSGQQITMGVTSSTTAPTSNTYVARNLFEGNTNAVSVAVIACTNCAVEYNLWAGQGSDAAGYVALQIGSDVSADNLNIVNVRGNHVSCANKWNYGIDFGTAATFNAVIFESNEFYRCVTAAIDNTNVTPTTSATDGWLYDIGNSTVPAHPGTGVVAGTATLFAVDGVAGGVITPMTREEAIGDLFTASASGSAAWTMIPRSNNTTATSDAGLLATNVTWRENTTTTSIQAWEPRPSILGNGLSLPFNTTDLNNGVIADTDFWTLSSGGSDISGTWLALVRLDADNASSKTLISKYNDQTDLFEWAFDVTGTETVRISLYDNSAGAATVFIGRTSTVTLTVGQWYLLMATYDGSASSAGLKLYRYSLTTAAQIDTTDANAGVYATMDNTAATPIIGGYVGTPGSVTGVCPCSMGYVGFIPGYEMSRAEGLQAAYALMPYAGVQLGR